MEIIGQVILFLFNSKIFYINLGVIMFFLPTFLYFIDKK